MSTTTVIQTAGFRILGPDVPALPTHGQVELVFNAWEPAQIDLLFHADEAPDEVITWMVSREAFTLAVTNPDKPHTMGDVQFWHSTDGGALIVTLESHEGLRAVEILLSVAKFFVEDVDRACPSGSPAEAEAMEALVDEVLVSLFA